MKDPKHVLKLDARTLYDLAYGRTSELRLVIKGDQYRITLDGPALPEDEYLATIKVRESK